MRGTKVLNMKTLSLNEMASAKGEGSKWCSLLVGGTIGIIAGFSAPATLGATIGVCLCSGIIADLVCSGWDEDNGGGR